MKVTLTETALSELQEIYAYIATNNLTAARAVVGRIERIIRRIGEFPEIASPIDGSEIRVFPVPPFPYLIFYTVGEREVIIRNVRHAGRKSPYVHMGRGIRKK